jgi:hypothetical protein
MGYLASSSNNSGYRNSSYDVIGYFFTRRTFQDSVGYPRYWTLLIEASSRSARLQGLHEVGPGRLLAAMLGDLSVSTLRFDQDYDSVFFSFWSIKPAMLPASMLGGYSTSAPSTPFCFPRRTDLLANQFLITSLLDLLFILFFFLDHHAGHPARHDAQILLMSASSMPSEFFHRCFDLLEARFL